jgi:hypothetical protein
MPTPVELRQNAEDCLKLAGEAKQFYAKVALIELADEFRALAEHLESRDFRRAALVFHQPIAKGRVDDS